MIYIKTGPSTKAAIYGNRRIPDHGLSSGESKGYITYSNRGRSSQAVQVYITGSLTAELIRYLAELNSITFDMAVITHWIPLCVRSKK